MFSQEGDALRLTGVDGERVEPEWLPAVVKPIEQTEVMTVEVEDVGDRGAVDQRQHHGPAQFGLEGRGLSGRKKAEGIGFAHRDLKAQRLFKIDLGR